LQTAEATEVECLIDAILGSEKGQDWQRERKMSTWRISTELPAGGEAGFFAREFCHRLYTQSGLARGDPPAHNCEIQRLNQEGEVRVFEPP